ncbi:hypothetical protein SAMN05216252_13341 [Actinacidiphila glaucinigra]|uniref:Peptidoglycan binding-like domain-containing protein n=1 Tax=Actinacidiphila glaucinigra TaxID=235986 RepID=A0A239NAA5_9ACTN|nr:hypothetical protein SAMN05216252_13341 [Actinacidiphila glaucinigra]
MEGAADRPEQVLRRGLQENRVVLAAGGGRCLRPQHKKAPTEAQDYFTNVPADIDGVYGPITRDLLLWRLNSGNGCWFYQTAGRQGLAGLAVVRSPRRLRAAGKGRCR